MKKFLVNVSLMGASLFALFLIMEFVVFRFVLKAPDMPELAYENHVLKYAPEQKGFYRLKNESPTEYRINSAGWNSGHENYTVEKRPGVKRVAIIGDSYVEARMVDYDRSMAEDLEGMLGSGYEVYRFGMSGAPMSQYLQMLRNEVLSYDPDLVIINLVHNDFDESFDLLPGTYTRSFLRVRVKDGEVKGEVVPQEFHRPWYSYIRTKSAIWRYLAVRQQVNFSALRHLFTPGKKEAVHQANIEVNGLESGSKNIRTLNIEAVTAYLFGQFRGIATENGFDLLITVDGFRHPIYRKRDHFLDYKSGPLLLNRIALETARELGIDCLDLHDVFVSDYRENQKRFNSEVDFHWNEYGHMVVARGIYYYLKQEGRVE